MQLFHKVGCPENLLYPGSVDWSLIIILEKSDELIIKKFDEWV